ncbi:PIR protein, putative [Plasmodium sp.]|nr:PIR protein, putative [Plasmodium sp.]
MKLQYSKILLFSLPLNILVSSSYGNNKNKTYVTSHIPTNTSRVLSECERHMSIYADDSDMKSLKENFHRQASKRFEEYEKRMIKNRQNYKEQCDKDIQQIILKDEVEKSLAEKVEKGCLKCGCGLGVVAASVGIFGSLTVNELKKAAMAAAIIAAEKVGAAEGSAQGAAAGVAKVIADLTDLGIDKVGTGILESIIHAKTYTNVSNISEFINIQYSTKCPSFGLVTGTDDPFCTAVYTLGHVQGDVPVSGSIKVSIETTVREIIRKATTTAAEVTTTATKKATSAAIETKTAAVETTYAIFQTAIIASVVALLVIVLIMVIIYFILHYRRKKKMKKKQQYTKLLNQ